MTQSSAELWIGINWCKVFTLPSLATDSELDLCLSLWFWNWNVFWSKPIWLEVQRSLSCWKVNIDLSLHQSQHQRREVFLSLLRTSSLIGDCWVPFIMFSNKPSETFTAEFILGLNWWTPFTNLTKFNWMLFRCTRLNGDEESSVFNSEKPNTVYL